MDKSKPKFCVGERVLCFEPDQSKARVLYDAKILDADLVKDGKNKKETEYKIHFQGWNSAWDRWANESFVLKNTEENKKLQRKLAKRAIKQLRSHGRKKVHLPGVASAIKNSTGNISDSGGSSDSDSASELGRTTPDSDSTTQSFSKRRRRRSNTSLTTVSNEQAECSDMTISDPALSATPIFGMPRKLSPLEIPPVLKRRLEVDNMLITKKNMLVEVPAKLSIVQILENYAKYFALHVAKLPSSEKAMKTGVQPTDVTLPERNLNLCKETCQDLRILFDFILPITLLYNNEQEQCKRLAASVRIITPYVGNISAIPDKPNSSSKTTSVTTGINEPLSPNPTAGENPGTSYKHEPGKRKGTPSKHGKTPAYHRKTAEEQIIEETHTYLIPHQPNLDRTGLSNDAQGRRRSSRLSHHLHSPTHSEGSVSSPISPCSIDSLSKCKGAAFPLLPVTMETEVFLRSPTNHQHGIKNEKFPNSSLSLLCKDDDKYSCSSSTIQFNQMCQEAYIGSAGEDIKRAVHLSQTWKFHLFPPDYQPPDGASVPFSLIYGMHHLLRLFVKIPHVFSKMDFPDYKLKIIYKHLHSLLRFLAEYDSEIYALSGSYVTMTP